MDTFLITILSHTMHYLRALQHQDKSLLSQTNNPFVMGKQQTSLMGLAFAPALFIYLLAFSMAEASTSTKIGICYGELGNNLPSPNRSIELIQNMEAGRVKLYDANPEILSALAGTSLKVSIMVPNNLISRIAANQSLADEWVEQNVVPFLPNTMIRFILVGNEVLSYNSSDTDRQTWIDLAPSMRRIKYSLKSYNISNIKIGTPLAMDMLQMTYPPSSAIFKPELTDTVMRPLLNFLNRTNSFFFIDVYPYFSWSADQSDISLAYALFQGGNFRYTDPASGLTYTNLLDQMLDSAIFAMQKLGYPNIRLAIAETGWPNAGSADEVGANAQNAAIYIRNVVNRMTAQPPIGTPARPGEVIPTFLFSLYDENQKSGPETERHWGLLHPDGRPIYEFDLTGRGEPPLPLPPPSPRKRDSQPPSPPSPRKRDSQPPSPPSPTKRDSKSPSPKKPAPQAPAPASSCAPSE